MKVIGTTEDRIGKVKQSLLGDLKNSVIDRNWAIDKMNEISLTRASNEINRGCNAQNRTIYNQNNKKPASYRQLDLFNDMPSVNDKKNECKNTKINKFKGISDAELVTELINRYKKMIKNNNLY